MTSTTRERARTETIYKKCERKKEGKRKRKHGT